MTRQERVGVMLRQKFFDMYHNIRDMEEYY
jgi:glucose-6-phosphate 1-dehydrogenase